MAQSAAMTKLSRNSTRPWALTSNGASSSMRPQRTRPAAARTSPRASWMEVSWSSAALSANGSPMSRARAIARSTRPTVAGSATSPANASAVNKPGLRREVVAGQRPPLAEQRRHVAGGLLGGHEPRTTVDQLGVAGQVGCGAGPVTGAQGGVGGRPAEAQRVDADVS